MKTNLKIIVLTVIYILLICQCKAQKTQKIENLEIRSEFWYNGTALISAKLLKASYTINGRTFIKFKLENDKIVVLRNLNALNQGFEVSTEFFTTKKEQKLLEENLIKEITLITGDGQSVRYQCGLIKLFNNI